MNEEIFRKIVSSFENIGISLECDNINYLLDNDLNLQDYIFDSLTFITLIISIEEIFEIELPDNISYYDSMSSLKSFMQLLETIIENSNNG